MRYESGFLVEAGATRNDTDGCMVSVVEHDISKILCSCAIAYSPSHCLTLCHLSNLKCCGPVDLAIKLGYCFQPSNNTNAPLPAYLSSVTCSKGGEVDKYMNIFS
jgi:hypothetical protein